MSNVIPSTWSEFPAPLRARFGKDTGKQRIMQHEGHLLIVLHLVPSHDAVQRVGAVFWRDPAGVWKSTPAAKGGLAGLRDLLESYRTALAGLEAVMEDPKSGAKEYFGVLQGVSPVYRSARSLHRTLQEAREAVPEERELIGPRDTAAEVERTAELLQGDAKSAIDYTIARRAEEQAELGHRIARSGHRLNLIAAFFLPLSALGSLFGANLAHGLEGVGAPWLFWTFVAISLAIGLWVRSSVRTGED